MAPETFRALRARVAENQATEEAPVSLEFFSADEAGGIEDKGDLLAQLSQLSDHKLVPLQSRLSELEKGAQVPALPPKTGKG